MKTPVVTSIAHTGPSAHAPVVTPAGPIRFTLAEQHALARCQSIAPKSAR